MVQEDPIQPAEQKTPPPKGWRAVLRISAGIGLLIIGIIGLILPIMPGWIFVIPGLVMLSDYFPPVKRLLDWAKKKMESLPGAGGGAKSSNSK